MKSFKNLIEETQQVQDLEELESSADLFQYGLDRYAYTLSQSKQFNQFYWSMKNKLTTDSIVNVEKFKGVNYLQLLSIVEGSPLVIKEDREQLMIYIKDRLKALSNNKRIA